MNPTWLISVVLLLQVAVLLVVGLMVAHSTSVIVSLKDQFLAHCLEFEKLLTTLEQLAARVTAGADASLRIESDAAKVASDLEASHARADAADGPHGAAADAAAQNAKS